MIRPTTLADTTALLAIAAVIGFEPAELNLLHQLLNDGFSDDSASLCLADDDEHHGPVGVAYCEPERMTDQTWNLQLIAMHPDHQGQGRGGQLLHHVEATLKARGGRLLMVETLASFDQARAFYLKNGFEEEARIRDFYAPGQDKIVFRKDLK
ncbi:MAG: GNAT family N-acetyltransferase [Kaiparowitsia implicata GSE-PSE-MK54-09C]|jgi:ribosomal protein S18 acetylase RimI-like enzyme|nr:GNAT family N-acetyltransferase [Kaiparowitsia implicata GSE-PSE-MK54-09C]